MPLIRRREVPVPTIWGWMVILGVGLAIVFGWLLGAEKFLASTHREEADVLVVEAWIGYAGLEAAKAEFVQGHYRYLVAAGGLSNNPWDDRRWNFADEAHDYLLREGLTSDQVLAARQSDTHVQRTHATAVAAWLALRNRGIHPRAINVFTLGPHARRSRLIFAKVFAPAAPVGVISWTPSQRMEGSWWGSSERSEDLVKETVGYLFELLLNSGRRSNAPEAPAPAGSSR